MTVRVERLRCQVPDGVLAIGTEPVRLSWRLLAAEPGDLANARQLGYRVDVAGSPTFDALLATTGDVEGYEQVAVTAPGGSLASREVRYIRVRVRDSEGWSGWSESLRVEAGLLRAADWLAAAITLPDDPGDRDQSPSPLVRREFDVSGSIARARLHVTAL